MGIFKKPPYFFSLLHAGWESLMTKFVDSLRRVMWRFSRFVQMPAWWEEIGLHLVVLIFALLSLLSTCNLMEEVLRFVGSFLIASALNFLGLLWIVRNDIPCTASALSIIWAGVFALAYAIAFMFF